MKEAVEFYGSVFKTDLKIVDDMGPQTIAMFQTSGDGQGVAGHIYEGKPAARGTGPTIHFVAPDKLEDALGRVAEAGGTVVSEPISIPAGRFAYCEDLDGNSFGVFTFG